MIKGKQYVAIAARDGGKNATKSGGSIIVFALPERTPATAGRTGRSDSE